MSNRKVVVNVKTLYFEGAGWEKAERSINTIGNCRVRTAFHLDNGKGVYLEIVCGEMLGERKKVYGGLQYVGFVDFLFYITDEEPNDDCNKHKLPDMRNTHFAYDFDSILAFVNSLGASFDNICVLPNLAGYRVHSDDRKKRYNYADEFTPDWEAVRRAEEIYEHFYKLEQSEGKKFPNFSLYNNESDKTRLYLIRHYNGYNKKWLIDASSDSWLKTIVEVS